MASRPRFAAQAIVDSAMTWDEAVRSNPAFSCPWDITSAQCLVTVQYVSFDGRVHEGQIVVHRDIAMRIQVVFKALLAARFPIQSVIPVADPRFAWDDHVSMAANNSSGFNYRYKDGTTELSWHAFGLAIDINPVQNPYIRGTLVQPSGAVYDPSLPGTLTPDCLAVQLFTEADAIWGGDWTDKKDYQHFEWPHLAPRQPP